MEFEIIGSVTDVKTIAAGPSIREIARLRKAYGAGRWRKLKGVATVRLFDGTLCIVEVHGYEAHGVGKRDLKIKHILEER